jgi:hypothetical protein
MLMSGIEDLAKAGTLFKALKKGDATTENAELFAKAQATLANLG